MANNDLIRQMLMNQPGQTLFNDPTGGPDPYAGQQDPSQQDPWQQQDPMAQSPQPQPQGADMQHTGAFLPEEARKPSGIRAMLMDFTGSISDALHHEMGLPTREEKDQEAMKWHIQQQNQAMALQRQAREDQFRHVQEMHMQAQEKRADAEFQFRKAQAASMAQQKLNAETSGEKLDAEMAIRAKWADSLHLEGDERINFIGNRDVKKAPPAEKNPTDASLALDEAHGDPALARQIIQKGKIATALASRPPKDTSSADGRRIDASANHYTGAIDKLQAPIDTLNMRMDRLKATLDQPNMMTDALAPPELMTVMAGGMGSGLRLNEAEIARVVGGRTKWESLKAQLNQWSTNPGTAVSIQPTQRSQMKALIGEVERQMQGRAAQLNEARDKVATSLDPVQHRKIYSGLRDTLSAPVGGSKDSGVTVQAPSGGWESILKKSKKVGRP